MRLYETLLPKPVSSPAQPQLDQAIKDAGVTSKTTFAYGFVQIGGAGLGMILFGPISAPHLAAGPRLSCFTYCRSCRADCVFCSSHLLALLLVMAHLWVYRPTRFTQVTQSIFRTIPDASSARTGTSSALTAAASPHRANDASFGLVQSQGIDLRWAVHLHGYAVSGWGRASCYSCPKQIGRSCRSDAKTIRRMQ